MALIQLNDVTLSYGDRMVLDTASLSVVPGERIGLVGPNGAGKSTVLGVIAGRLAPDHGTIFREGSMSVLAQEPVLAGPRVHDACEAAVAWHRQVLDDWQRAIEADDVEAAGVAQDRLDQAGWEIDHKVDALLTQVGAPPRDALVEGLSGGEKRRVALALTLLSQADVLLLDEPTNHLDADVAEWLQRFLQGYRGAIVLVTHDRYLLEAVAERIVEVEYGSLVSYDGSYTDYLTLRAERHSALHQTERRRLALLAREVEWASRSPAARSTKQRARLDRLESLRERGVVPRDAEIDLAFTTGRKLSGTVFEAHELSAKVPHPDGGDRWLFRDLELSLLAGERLGVLGPNGAGKSTLLKILAGQRPADGGTVRLAPRVTMGLLDQHREGLVDTDTLFEAAAGGADQVLVGDRPVHVITFLERFAFRREQMDTKVGLLSGGERARLLLAKLMLRGAGLLLLDEPTNDLDLLTLAILEEALRDFDGSVVVVTHDRAFLDRVCTRVLAFEDDGSLVGYADRLQHLAARQARANAAQAEVAHAANEPTVTPAKQVTAPKSAAKRLSFKEQRELDALPEQIEVAEGALAAIEARLADPALYKDNAANVAAVTAESEAAQRKIADLYARWEALAARA